MLLEGKTVVISGVGPGMGQAMAKLAAAEGANVAIGARSEDFLESVAKEVESAGGNIVHRRSDVTKKADCDGLAKAASDRFGGITSLINSAYMHGEWAPVDQIDPDEIKAIVDVNAIGALRMAQACVPAMERGGGGAIVNVSTMSTVKPFQGEGGYATGKGALNSLTKHMANDLGAKGIRVNAARMGWIGGAPVQGFIDAQVAAGRPREEVVGEITSRIALGIIPPEDDCARGVLMLLSDYAAVVTGAVIDINGGEYMAP